MFDRHFCLKDLVREMKNRKVKSCKQGMQSNKSRKSQTFSLCYALEFPILGFLKTKCDNCYIDLNPYFTLNVTQNKEIVDFEFNRGQKKQKNDYWRLEESVQPTFTGTILVVFAYFQLLHKYHQIALLLMPC
jgi:hypothetical protein